MRLTVVALLVLCACGKKDQADQPGADAAKAKSQPTGPTKPPPTVRRGAGAPVKPMGGGGEVELAFTGAVTAKLSGKGAMCRHFDPQAKTGAMIGVESKTLDAADDFRFQVIVGSEAEWTNPRVLVNRRTPQGTTTFAWAKRGKVEVAKDLSGLVVDGVLTAPAGGGELTVQGTIRCPKPPPP